jgi:ABC-type Fe3+ transport system substrate-binding protein
MDHSAGPLVANVFPSDGTFAIPATTSAVKGSKSPNAAKLLAEYTLSLEAQKLCWGEGTTGERRIL